MARKFTFKRGLKQVQIYQEVKLNQYISSIYSRRICCVCDKKHNVRFESVSPKMKSLRQTHGIIILAFLRGEILKFYQDLSLCLLNCYFLFCFINKARSIIAHKYKSELFFDCSINMICILSFQLHLNVNLLCECAYDSLLNFKRNFIGHSKPRFVEHKISISVPIFYPGGLGKQ